MNDKNFPALPASVEPQTRKFLFFVKDKISQLLGKRMNRAVTFEDLVELGIIDKNPQKSRR